MQSFIPLIIAIPSQIIRVEAAESMNNDYWTAVILLTTFKIIFEGKNRAIPNA